MSNMLILNIIFCKLYTHTHTNTYKTRERETQTHQFEREKGTTKKCDLPNAIRCIIIFFFKKNLSYYILNTIANVFKKNA